MLPKNIVSFGPNIKTNENMVPVTLYSFGENKIQNELDNNMGIDSSNNFNYINSQGFIDHAANNQSLNFNRHSSMQLIPTSEFLN